MDIDPPNNQHNSVVSCQKDPSDQELIAFADQAFSVPVDDPGQTQAKCSQEDNCSDNSTLHINYLSDACQEEQKS